MSKTIGGTVCSQPLAERLLPAEPRNLTRTEVDSLWSIFVAIGRAWKNTVHDSAGQKSSWLEFVNERTRKRPSYIAEYVNALEVVAELEEMYQNEAFERLFFRNGIPDRALDTKLAHAKHFVVDEFIRVQLISGGFKNFITPHEPEIRPQFIVNYNGFVAGSRFNRISPVRPFEEHDG